MDLSFFFSHALYSRGHAVHIQGHACVPQPTFIEVTGLQEATFNSGENQATIALRVQYECVRVCMCDKDRVLNLYQAHVISWYNENNAKGQFILPSTLYSIKRNLLNHKVNLNLCFLALVYLLPIFSVKLIRLVFARLVHSFTLLIDT